MSHESLDWVTIVCSLAAIVCMLSVTLDLRRTRRIMRAMDAIRNNHLEDILENVKEIDRRRESYFEERYKLVCELARQGIDPS